MDRPLLNHRLQNRRAEWLAFRFCSFYVAAGMIKVGGCMTLKPNYTRAFLKTFLCIFILIAVFTGVVPHLEGKEVHFGDIVSMAAFGGALLGIVVIVMFTPREITWDGDKIRIRALFAGSGEFEWRQLEAWSPYGRGTFLIKFEERQAFQIAPAGFRSDEWRAFRTMLQQRFPEKKTLFWIGVRPIRFRKK
jgi:hypothetical protein